MKTHFSIIAVIFCMCFASSGFAQTIIAGVSPKGVVLHYEGPLRGFDVEVLKNGNPFGSIKTANSSETFEKELRNAEALFPLYPTLNDSQITRVQSSLGKAETTETVFMKYMLTVKLAANLALIDSKGSPADIYTALINDQDVPLSWDRLDAKYIEPAFTPGSNKSWYGDIETFWSIRKGNPILFTRIFRKDHQAKEYELVKDADFRATRSGDSLAMIARDTSIDTYSYFNYQLVGFDFYGNPTELSQPLLADNLDNSTLPIALSFTATETDDKSQVAVKWKIRHSKRVKSLILQRSLKSDTSYTIVTHLSPTDSVYFDNVVNPMEAVYYRLLIYDLKGLMDHTPTVPMVSHQKPVVIQPNEISSKLVNKQPVISWKAADLSSRGFRVFRTSTIGAEPELVSSIIQIAQTLDYSWTDTNAYLIPGKSYHYAVAAESKGYVLSDFSDFTTIQMENSAAPDVPQGLLARKLSDQHIFLVWNTQGMREDQVSVYQVYRSENEAGPWEIVNDYPVFAENSYIDTLKTIPKEIYYCLTSLASGGKESAKTLPVRVSFEGAQAGIPYLLAKSFDKGIELNWPTGDPRIKEVIIERGNGQDKPISIGKFPLTQSSFLDTDVKSGNTYYYRVISVLADGKNTEPGNWVGASF
ncbi:MAG: hypothetical protein WED33_00410 [Bacteroidia bacterium]